jgi:ferredoxin
MRGRAFTLLVDPTACDGHGVCAELFPEWIENDPWGFPVVDRDDLPPELIDHALRAVKSCPRQALHLIDRPK